MRAAHGPSLARTHGGQQATSDLAGRLCADFEHKPHGGRSQRTLCDHAVWRPRAGHARIGQQAQQQVQQQQPNPILGADESKDSELPQQNTFLLCCRQMGNCLCEHAAQNMAFNKRHGLLDPRLLPEWQRRNHPLFRHDPPGTNPFV